MAEVRERVAWLRLELSDRRRLLLVVFMLAFPVSVTAFSGDRQLEGCSGCGRCPCGSACPSSSG